MVITSYNVGIGTTSPATAFHVNAAGSGDKVKIGNGTRDAFFAADSSGVSLGNEASQAGELLYLNQASGYVSIFTDGGERQKIDSSGNITAPNQPSFMCYPTSGSWTQAGGSAQITFGSESFDKGGNYNTSNGRFTAPIAGRYLFIMELAVNASTSALTYHGIGLRINGSSSVYFGGWGQKNIGGSTNAYAKASSTIILELSANDYVETYIELSGSHGLLGGTSGAHTRWSGQLLS